MYCVYVLLCADMSLYTGITNNLERRFEEHKNKKGGRYTRSHIAKKIIYIEEQMTKSAALKREKQIKGWPREKKIKVLNLVKLIN